MEKLYILIGGSILGILIGWSFHRYRHRHRYSINYKLNQLMADSAQIKQQVKHLNTKVDDLQTSLDAEQAVIKSLFDTNAEVVTGLNTEIARLQAIIDAGGTVTPADLQEISDGIQTATDKIATSKEDLEGTVEG